MAVPQREVRTSGRIFICSRYLYISVFEEMNIDPKILKRQTVTVLYYQKATLPRDIIQLWQKGFFPVEDLTTFRKTGSYLQGHRI